VVEKGVEGALQVLGGLLVRKREHFLDELVDSAASNAPDRKVKR
jgi:hypothetical protein